MGISLSMNELLWNVSWRAIGATSNTRGYVLERDSRLRLRPATEHEETTTSNLLRDIGYLGQALGARAVQHSRKLEGGVSWRGQQISVPSGADLELAIEVSPGRWLDLLLQAKALKPSGTYTSWSPEQNMKLIDWADDHGRVPGMLLYNDYVPPFVANPAFVTSPDYKCAAFGACTQVRRTQIGWWGLNEHCFGPESTPAGISMCLDIDLMLASPVPVSTMRASHFQLEHLLHDSEYSNPLGAGGATLDELLRPTAPAWARQLLDEQIQIDSGRDDGESTAAAGSPTTVEVAARASAVIPFRDRG
jgi:hypothetical protein